MSLIEAPSFFKSGGHLPIVGDKNELAEIISLLKLSKTIPPVEALYIGLIRNSKHKVVLVSEIILFFFFFFFF